MDILPLLKNKNVKIIKNSTNYEIICLKRELTPGVYSKINFEKNKWYTIEICCTKFGYGSPGLWIAEPNKKTLFYGNYFTKLNKGYLKRNFYTGNYSNLLIGILIKNANFKSGFILEKLSVTKIDNQNKSEELNEKESKTTKTLFKDKIKCTNLFLNSEDNKDINPTVNNISNNTSDFVTEIVDELVDTNFKKNIKDITEDQKCNLEIEDINPTVNNISNNTSDFVTEIVDENKTFYSIEKIYGDIEFNVNISYEIVENFKVYPISFGIPKNIILENITEKNKNFLNYNLEKPLLSMYEKNPDQLYKDLEKSRFILISKNEYGIDDPIYYEALSKGCIPLFINDIPDKSCVFLPKQVINSIKKAEGVNLGWIDEHKFSKEGFNKISNHLLDYTRDYLTTESVADYIIHIAGKEVNRVLFLSYSQENGDFLLQQSLLHGLKNKLGYSNVIDYPKVISLYKDINPTDKIRLGLPYNNTLIDKNTCRGRINKRIENREFDLVIIMGIFTKKDRERLKLDNGDFPMSNEIKTYYNKNEIFFVDGSCNNVNEPISSRLYNYANQGIYFYKDFI